MFLFGARLRQEDRRAFGDKSDSDSDDADSDSRASSGSSSPSDLDHDGEEGPPPAHYYESLRPADLARETVVDDVWSAARHHRRQQLRALKRRAVDRAVPRK